jgi:glyoxylase-like metal-dependent hydrolase (beta-lactamase superfamily II)/8-oxo-dGTP pyrophosphatase MutT (NUDIX family)
MPGADMSSTSRPSSSAPAAGRTARPAATLVVVRSAPAGMEVLLLLRAERGDHNSGAWVFPGGLVDAPDRDWHACCTGLDDSAASAQLALPHGGLDYHVAVLRECFEECGLLFAVDAQGRTPGADATAALQHWRGPLHRGELTLGDFCRETGLCLAVDRLVYLSHWLTPLARAKRFDTRFFIAEAPEGQVALHDGAEMTAHVWLRPADALAQGNALKLMGPTRATLQTLLPFDSAAAAMQWARSPREIPRIFPRMATGAQGERPVMENDHAWAEVGHLDPHGHGTARYDIEPERPLRLSPRVIRVTANNGSVMTGPGTNTYLVGGGDRNEWAVIDPGPLDAAHVQAIVDAAPGPVRWIFVTHTHKDHSPAAVLLKARSGAQLLGRLPEHAKWQDASFVPDRVLAGGERIALDGSTLRVIHTPGHASNHLCYLLEEEKTLFTGDHVMQSSTVVINPPDGDMAAYLASLRALASEEGDSLDWLAPGHGFLMAQPRRAFEAIVAHRLRREAKVVAALREFGTADAGALLARVYDDVRPALHPVAMRSLSAHLIKLRSDGIAVESQGHWSLAREHAAGTAPQRV